MHDTTLLAKKLIDMKVMHKDLNDKLNIAYINAEILKSENSVLKPRISELSNNNHVLNKSKNDKLIAEISKLELRVSSLHAKKNELNVRIDDLTCKILALTSENKNIKLELDKYQPIVDKFIYSSKKLNMILISQWAMFKHA